MHMCLCYCHGTYGKDMLMPNSSKGIFLVRNVDHGADEDHVRIAGYIEYSITSFQFSCDVRHP